MPVTRQPMFFAFGLLISHMIIAMRYQHVISNILPAKTKQIVIYDHNVVYITDVWTDIMWFICLYQW